MKCRRENHAVPGGLCIIFHPTQDSAYGSVLGHHDAAPTALDFRRSQSTAEMAMVVLTQTRKSCPDTKLANESSRKESDRNRGSSGAEGAGRTR